MEELEKTLEKDASRANLSEYDRLSNAYLTGGGYEQDTEVDKVCNGLASRPKCAAGNSTACPAAKRRA